MGVGVGTDDRGGVEGGGAICPRRGEGEGDVPGGGVSGPSKADVWEEDGQERGGSLPPFEWVGECRIGC